MRSSMPAMRVGIATLTAATLLALSAGIGLAQTDAPTTATSDAPTTAPPSPSAEPALTGEEVQALAGPVAYTIIQGDGCELATVGLADGVVTDLTGSASALSCVADLTFGPDGNLYGIIGINTSPLAAHLVRFDLTTGLPTDLGSLTGNFASSTVFGSSDVGIATGGDGRVYVTMTTDETAECGPTLCVYDVNVATLVATLVGPAGAPSGPFDDKPLLTMTADCGTTMWTVVSRSDTVQQLFLTTVSQSTGAATDGPVIGLTPGANPFGIEFDRNSRNLYLLASDLGPEALYILDPGTGAATPVAPLSGDGEQLGKTRLAILGACPVAIAAEPTFTG